MQNTRFVFGLAAICLLGASPEARAQVADGGVRAPRAERHVFVPPREDRFVPGQVVVRFKNTLAIASAHKAFDTLKSKNVTILPDSDLAVIETPYADRDSLVQALTKTKGAQKSFALIEPNYLYYPAGFPNDPEFPRQWGLSNTGTDDGIAGADIDALAGWGLDGGLKENVVAIIDTGIDYTHPDLIPSLWTNPGEIPGNGIDDDKNGYVDDVHGINTTVEPGDLKSGDPMDVDGHGTHVAGIIAARGDNGLGIAGVNWNTKVIACKFIEGESGTLVGATRCLDYVLALKKNGVPIVATNNSWGGPSRSDALLEAITRQQDAGILFVAAAGNWGVNIDGGLFFPAAYRLPNVISVAATDNRDALASFSNYGATLVSLAAPGEGIYSTLPGGAYGYLDGTSMASPFVTGLLAVFSGKEPQLLPRDLTKRLLEAATPLPGLQGKVLSGKRARNRAIQQAAARQ